ncbi:MerR family transcriptional regulator [Paraburkholderia eburnea]|uniref:MerR family transcriptional regulator n=1 Tax=Paraburkholderia eburnea TaxID=1189126 RepID=A0A2S4M8Y9_9BURK|nr:MerR family transcriptional regulator [Paraburkholderia eburnea]POR51208.1 MerR family transcriptional regulator [Paraburkholderia eburnea]PRZ21942.1 MerR family transcriptional regulator [Paraburkholderia eburnea]
MPKSSTPPETELAPERATDSEYTVDELARVANTTVRNVRAYQDRDLLMPPDKRGRVGIYNDSHVARLKLINHLLARGYTLSNIQDLIKAIDDGGDLRSILGLENAIGGPWSHARPKTYSLPELIKLFGPQAPSNLTRLAELGLLERKGLSFVARNPAMLDAAAATVREGIPARELLDVLEEARPHFDAIARVLVEMVVRHLDRYDQGALPPATDMPALVDAIWRLRPLSTVFVENEILRALEEQSSDYLGGRVATILDQKLGRRGTPEPQSASAQADETAEKAPRAAKKAARKKR